MKNTQTPFDTKVEILSNLYLEYQHSTEAYSELEELVMEYKEVFALALCINIGQAIPTEAGIEILNRFFDDVCEIQGITEDVAIKNYHEILK
jgi:hypothetical protein